MRPELMDLYARCESAMAVYWPEKTFVFGEGCDDHPPVMLIGEAPGAQETLQRRPFVGQAGKNLDEFLSVIQLNRSDIYIGNTVKFRPTKVSTKGTESNRTPTGAEIKAFLPFLREEILLVQPSVLVTLGNTALQAVTGDRTVIGSCHGTVMPAVVSGQAFRLFPLYHPASIIYNRALKEVYAEDLQALRLLLERDD